MSDDLWVVIWEENGENRIHMIFDNEKDATEEAEYYNNEYGAKDGKAGERLRSFDLSSGNCLVDTNLFFVEKHTLTRGDK